MMLMMTIWSSLYIASDERARFEESSMRPSDRAYPEGQQVFGPEVFDLTKGGLMKLLAAGVS